MTVSLTSFLLLLHWGLTAVTSGTAETHTGTGTGTQRQATPDSRIIDGEDAVEGRYPYTVSISRISTLDHECTGTLIAPDMILAAASCLRSSEPLAARIGPHNVNIPVEGSEIFPVLERVIHPDFVDWVADFALLKLDGTSTTMPVQLNKDAAIPVDGQQSRLISWGITEKDLYAVYDTLKVSDSSIYINNADCERLLINTSVFSEDDTLTDDTMCTMDPYQVCLGFDGGSSIIPGATADEDVQVGIYSWTYDCAAKVFAQVSWGYDFIRSNVCRMSVDPPSSFQCTDSERIRPTAMPTSSPAPTGEQVDILLQLFTDNYPDELGWRLEDFNGLVLYEKLSFSFIQRNSVVLEVLSVTLGASYVLILTNTCGDGNRSPVAVQVFLGNTVDSNQLIASSPFPDGSEQRIPILASADGVQSNTLLFTLPPQYVEPSATPSVSLAPTSINLIDVTVFIKFDSRPTDTSWILERADGRLMAQGGSYSPFIGSNITQVVSVDFDQIYIFTLYDNQWNGICCEYGFGEAFVYLGSQVPLIKTDNVLAYDDGRFGRERKHAFIASPDSIIDLVIAPPVPVTIVIWFDGSPGDVGWSILANEGIIMDVEPGTYTNELSLQMVQTIVRLKAGGAYTIQFVDSAGDGYCCDNGVGNITVYIGSDLLESNILTASTGGLTDFESSKFGVPEYLVESVPSPVPSSESSVPVSIVIWFDRYPGEVEWRLSRDGAIIMDVPFDTYRYAWYSQMVRTVVELQIDETYEVMFFDRLGGSYHCGYGGNIAVYVGTELLESNVLAADSGGSFTAQFVVPTLPTATPSTTPSTAPTIMPTIDPTIMSSPTPTTTPTVMSSPTPTTAPTIMASSTATIMPTIMSSSTPSSTPSSAQTVVPSVAAAQSSNNLPSSSACVSTRLLLLIFSTLIGPLLIDGIF